MNGYVQTRCPRCGNAAWGHPTQAVPCQSCGQQVPPQMQSAPMPAPMAPQGWGAVPGMGGAPGMPMGGAPGMYVPPGAQNAWSAPPVATQGSAPSMGIPLPGGFKLPFKLTGASGGLSYFKIIGGIVLVIALGIGGLIFKMKFVTPKGMISYSAVSLEKGKPDADKAITQLAGVARKWKKDAIFWSANFQAVRADGTVDVSKGAEVVYTSPGNSASYAKSQRNDSLKKYGFTAKGITNKGTWGWNDPIKDLEAHPVPKCLIKDVIALLVKDGTLKQGKTVRVTFDPKFADFYAWHVLSDDPAINANYSWDDCSLIK